MKNLLCIISVVLNVLLAGGGAYLWHYSQQAQNNNAVLRKKIEDGNRENKALIDDRRRAHIDLEFYKTAGERLKTEKKRLESDIAEIQGKTDLIKEVKEADIQALKVRLKQLKLNFIERKRTLEVQNEQLSQENEALKEEALLFESALKELNSLYHNNMGVAFTRAQLFDKAIASYEQSVVDSPTNAEAFYNLGLLYQNVKNDARKAIEYFQKYLALEPDAAERPAIEQTIAELSEGQ